MSQLRRAAHLLLLLFLICPIFPRSLSLAQKLYISCSARCVLFEISHSELVRLLLKRNIFSAILWNPFFFPNPPGWEEYKKKTIYCLSILTLSRCSDHKLNFTIYFCTEVHACRSCTSVAGFGCSSVFMKPFLQV